MLQFNRLCFLLLLLRISFPYLHSTSTHTLYNWAVLTQYVIYVYIMGEQDTIFENLSNNNCIPPPHETHSYSHYQVRCFCCHVVVIIIIIVGKKKMRWVIRILFYHWGKTNYYSYTSTKYDLKKKKKKKIMASPANTLSRSTHTLSHTNTHSGHHITNRSTE